MLIYDTSDQQLQAIVCPSDGGGRFTLSYNAFGQTSQIELPHGKVSLSLNGARQNGTKSSNGHSSVLSQAASNGDSGVAATMPITTALRVPWLLLKLGFEKARRTGRDLWEHAASVCLLDSVGLPRWQLARMLSEGLAVCRDYPAGRNDWSLVEGLAGISGCGYVVLTDWGAELATEHFDRFPIRPHYAAEQASLFVETVRVKDFQNSAPGQEPILEELERLNWPGGIDIGGRFLSEQSVADGAKNLSKKLNFNHLVPLIHFGSRGGSRITWEFIVPIGPGPTSAPV